jgi:uncharacterized damage-inducible protein DinB
MTGVANAQQQPKVVSALLSEIEREAATTKRVLERVPTDKLSWQPQPKSMTLGQLTMHIAKIPGDLSRLAQVDEFDVSTANFTPPMPKDIQESLTTLDDSVKAAQEYIGGLTESALDANWRMTFQGKEVFTISRIDLIRSIMLNHWYHHRGQLSVYLRLLDLPVPSIYGPSGDENPFG